MPKDRKVASLAMQLIAVSNGADCIRTHDIQETYDSFKKWLRFLKLKHGFASF